MPENFLSYPVRGHKFSYSIEIKENLFSAETGFQRIDVYDTFCFGKLLTLDGHVQLSTFDEFAYHEALVHIPMMSLSGARKALVVGGGDGGVLRELCKWKGLEAIDLVEIDEGVIEASRKHLPQLSSKAFEDPRVRVHIRDAFGFLDGVSAEYDFIVMDVTDVYEGEDGALSESLFTEEFHAHVKDALTENGFLVSQADNHVFCPYSLAGLKATLAGHYAHIGSYQALVPSFGGFSAFCWASKSAKVDESWKGDRGLSLRYLNETTHRLAFCDLGF